jgi:very-short-patch-repair endonuclease
MRKNPTEPERRLWTALRDSRLSGFKFRRQAVIGSRIADFFCPSKGLIVEIDGETHDRARDLVKDGHVHRETGFRTVRFTNEDVMRNLDGVLTQLELILESQPDRWSVLARHHPPAPSSEEEGGT